MVIRNKKVKKISMCQLVEKFDRMRRQTGLPIRFEPVTGETMYKINLTWMDRLLLERPLSIREAAAAVDAIVVLRQLGAQLPLPTVQERAWQVDGRIVINNK